MGENGDLNVADEAAVKIQAQLSIMEDCLEGLQFLAGDKPTIADLALATNIFQLGLANEIPTTPNIVRWYKNIAALKGFQKSLPQS